MKQLKINDNHQTCIITHLQSQINTFNTSKTFSNLLSIFINIQNLSQKGINREENNIIQDMRGGTVETIKTFTITNLDLMQQAEARQAEVAQIERQLREAIQARQEARQEARQLGGLERQQQAERQAAEAERRLGEIDRGLGRLGEGIASVKQGIASVKEDLITFKIQLTARQAETEARVREGRQLIEQVQRERLAIEALAAEAGARLEQTIQEQLRQEAERQALAEGIQAAEAGARLAREAERRAELERQRVAEAARQAERGRQQPQEPLILADKIFTMYNNSYWNFKVQLVRELGLNPDANQNHKDAVDKLTAVLHYFADKNGDGQISMEQQEMLKSNDKFMKLIDHLCALLPEFMNVCGIGEWAKRHEYRKSMEALEVPARVV